MGTQRCFPAGRRVGFLFPRGLEIGRFQQTESRKARGALRADGGQESVWPVEGGEEAIANEHDVVAHGLSGLPPGLFFESLVDPGVGDGCCCCGELVGARATEESFLLNVFEDAAELLIACGRGNHGVEAHVLFDMFELVAILEELLGTVDAGGEVTEKFWCDVGGFDGMDFEYLAEFVEVANLFRRELADIGSAARLDADETLCFEAIEGFADR